MKSDKSSTKIIQKCNWCTGDPLLEKYHDSEWGKPIKNDNRLFERMTLEVFQAGLIWKTILYKREFLKIAFDDFDIEKVAKYKLKDFKRLLSDKSIIRNHLKISSTIKNAKSLLKIQKNYGSFLKFLTTIDPFDKDIIKTMKSHFSFMGPEIVKCFFMGIGKIPAEHDKNCWKNIDS